MHRLRKFATWLNRYWFHRAEPAPEDFYRAVRAARMNAKSIRRTASEVDREVQAAKAKALNGALQHLRGDGEHHA